MLSPRGYLPLLGSLLISSVLAQNQSCIDRQPAGYGGPSYSFLQPFNPYFAPNGTKTYDDPDGAISYKGQWANKVDPKAVNSTLHYTSDTSASVSFTFTGSGIEWIGTTGASHGKAKVILSTEPPTEEEVDASSGPDYEQQRLWSKLDMPVREYTITIQNLGGGSGNLLDLDAFVVTTIPSYVVSDDRVDHADGWSLIQKGYTGVAAMQITVVSPTHVIIFDKTEHNYASINGHPAWAALYDLNTHSVRPLDLQTNSFCASGSFLSNGTLLNVGGNVPAIQNNDPGEYRDLDGRQSFRIVEPCLDPSGPCTIQDMVNATSVIRWYPTILRITDGSVLIIGGGHENVFENNRTINEPSVSFFPSAPSTPASFGLPFLNRTLNANLFPHSFSLPNKRALIVANTESIIFNWGVTPPVEEKAYPLPGGIRVTYPMAGTALLLPLSSKDNYTSHIIVCGGQDAPDTLCDFEYSARHPASSQCSRIEIKRDGTTDGWKLDDSMAGGARVMPDGVLLPTGELLIVNGARAGYMGFGSVIDPIGLSNAADPALSPIVYSPEKEAGQRWRELGVKSNIPRLYHSVATLTPNGDIMIAGSNPNPDRTLTINPTDYRVEWLSPPYMNGERPTFTGLNNVIAFGSQFTLNVNIPSSLDKSKIKVSLMDFGFSTHSLHSNTRMVFLDATLDGDKLTVTAPPDAGVYPPGPGYIFVVVDNVASKGAYTLIGDGKAPTPH